MIKLRNVGSTRATVVGLGKSPQPRANWLELSLAIISKKPFVQIPESSFRVILAET